VLSRGTVVGSSAAARAISSILPQRASTSNGLAVIFCDTDGAEEWSGVGDALDTTVVLTEDALALALLFVTGGSDVESSAVEDTLSRGFGDGLDTTVVLTNAPAEILWFSPEEGNEGAVVEIKGDDSEELSLCSADTLELVGIAVADNVVNGVPVNKGAANKGVALTTEADEPSPPTGSDGAVKE